MQKGSVMGKYLKYSSCNLLGLLAICSFLAGGAWLWVPLFFTLIVAVFGDAALPDDTKEDSFHHLWVLNTFLFLNLPLLFIANFVLLWHVSDVDAFGFGAALTSLGWDVLAHKDQTGAWDIVGGFLGLGLIFGVAGTNVAHELVHRTWSKASVEVGRWLLAFTWDGEFAIEHVYGHHQKVATWDDPASARRGETVFRFLSRSILSANRSAWEIEAHFLRKKQLGLFGWHNRVLRGWTYSLLLAILAFAVAGWWGLAFHLVLALYGKCYLELVNYIEHYGLVRLPQSKVQFRHSWNSNASVSSWFLYNLTRHSHHHETGHLPFWRLQPKVEAPRLPFGYMTMILIALVPPIYKRLMQPYLELWDREFASPEERAWLQTRGLLTQLTD
jgi:hypothetical protein